MSKRKMYLKMVLASILRRRSRVFVAMLAVAIGATTLSALVTIAIDVPRQMAREIRSYGANLVLLARGQNASFSPQVLEQVRREVPEGQLVGAAGIEYQPITINDIPYVAAGAEMEKVRQISPYWYVEGAWPTQGGQVMIGKEIATTVGAQVGDSITLNQLATSSGNGKNSPAEGSKTSTVEAGQAGTAPGAQNSDSAEQKRPQGAPKAGASLPVTIAGIVETGGSEDGFVYLFPADLEKLTGTPHHLTVAELSIAVGQNELKSLSERINKQYHAVNATPVARLASTDATVLQMLRSLMAIITVIVLALIMIGVSTTMMAVVTERRNEIGLRKALGATDRSIIGEFLGEGMVLGIVGGIAGAILGYILAQAISINVFHRSVDMHWYILLATVVVSALISVAASAIPVRRAVEIDPALVLRGE